MIERSTPSAWSKPPPAESAKPRATKPSVRQSEPAEAASPPPPPPSAAAESSVSRCDDAGCSRRRASALGRRTSPLRRRARASRKLVARLRLPPADAKQGLALPANAARASRAPPPRRTAVPESPTPRTSCPRVARRARGGALERAVAADASAAAASTASADGGGARSPGKVQLPSPRVDARLGVASPGSSLDGGAGASVEKPRASARFVVGGRQARRRRRRTRRRRGDGSFIARAARLGDTAGGGSADLSPNERRERRFARAPPARLRWLLPRPVPFIGEPLVPARVSSSSVRSASTPDASAAAAARGTAAGHVGTREDPGPGGGAFGGPPPPPRPPPRTRAAPPLPPGRRPRTAPRRRRRAGRRRRDGRATARTWSPRMRAPARRATAAAAGRAAAARHAPRARFAHAAWEARLWAPTARTPRPGSRMTSSTWA